LSGDFIAVKTILQVFRNPSSLLASNCIIAPTSPDITLRSYFRSGLLENTHPHMLI